jgi:translation initiation factor 2B subunit (eIF-2B alpha/beta/delta family)
MKLQQQRVDRLNVQLGEIRSQLVKTRASMAQFSTVMKNVESELARETNAARRADLEQSSQSFKAQLEEATQKEQQQHEAEIQLTAQVQLEQAKLTELSERLDTLQRELETQLAPDKLPPSGKQP